MKAIWKFPLAALTNSKISMPKRARVLTVQVQADVGPVLWALVDPKAESEYRHFETVFTGDEMGEETRAYIGTFQVGPLVWHVFEVFRA